VYGTEASAIALDGGAAAAWDVMRCEGEGMHDWGRPTYASAWAKMDMRLLLVLSIGEPRPPLGVAGR
jgi:hypothetical protein